jgi:hypothetical protein
LIRSDVEDLLVGGIYQRRAIIGATSSIWENARLPTIAKDCHRLTRIIGS